MKQGTTTTRAFSYNARGDVILDTRGTTGYIHGINNAGRIRNLTIGTVLKATWTYDGFQKLRVKAATSPAATTHYVWDSFGHIIAEHNATGGAALKQYIWLGDTPLALIDGTTLYYVHPDNLDRPVFMTNATAQTIAWSAKYDPFGVPFAVTVTPVNTQRLPGQWFQSEDGLSYNWHRTYDPTLGRYTQADPLGFVDGPGIYNYAGGSPVMGVDPSGQIVPILIGIGGGLLFDYFLEKYKEEKCTCSDGSTFGPLGNAALGGAIGGTGRFYEKPRVGIAGGGKSGRRTSAGSLGLHKTTMPRQARRLLRQAFRKIPYLGAGFSTYELYKTYNCE